MGTISELFNFDNIGGKIKNFAKWYCWIAVLLIWIAAPITLIVLLCNRWTAYLAWIPFVSAIVGPILVWLGSWPLYAFGEFVEDIHAMRNKEGTTMETEAKREAEEKKKQEAEKRARLEAEEKQKREAEKRVKFDAEEKQKQEAEKKQNVTPKKEQHIADEELVEDNYIDIVCPHCHESLSFFESETNPVCPWCDTKINLK